MTLTSLWCAVSTVQSHTSLLRSWAQWWPLTPGLVWWVEGTPSVSKYWQQNLLHRLPRPLQAQPPSCRTCYHRHSPHMSPSSRRHPGAIHPWALTHQPTLLPPQPHSLQLQMTLLSPRATARRLVAPVVRGLRGILKVQGKGTAVYQLWRSISNRSHRSWIRCTSMMVS